jgi:guanylate kinase
MKKIIIVGKSGSGKNYLLNGLIAKNLKYSPKLTTRPKRINETDGIDYSFTNNDNFENLITENKIHNYQKFIINNEIWYYGFLNEHFENNNLFILTPLELSKIENREQFTVVFIDADEKTLRKRLLNRNDGNDSIDRRIASDNKDFENFSDYDVRITNSFFDIEEIYNSLML